MCRLTAYKGRPLLIGDLIVKPENGLLYQSRDAAWHPGVADGIGKRNIRVNADGFGVAWYSRETLTSEESVEKQVGSHTYGGAGIHGLRAYMYESCVYKFVTPAWSSRNLKNIGEHVQSSLIFAHIRAGSNGLLPEESFNISVTEENCHPFQYRQWTFMHNGGVPNFGSIKLPIVHLLDELCWNGIAGSTDSEYIFALFLALLPDREALNVDLDTFVETVEKTIACVLELCRTHGGGRSGDNNNSQGCNCSLNLVITDGCHIIATRFRTPGAKFASEPPSLYYNWGSNFICEEGQFRMEQQQQQQGWDGTSNGGSGSGSGSGIGDGACSDVPANEIVISSAPLSRDIEVVLETGCPSSFEYPTEMMQERAPSLDSSVHSDDAFSMLSLDVGGGGGGGGGCGSSSGPGSVGRKARRTYTFDGERAETYERMGQWVLMPKNHMLVCVGHQDDPASVQDVFLQDISDVHEAYPEVCSWQAERREDMDTMYKARAMRRAESEAADREAQLERIRGRQEAGNSSSFSSSSSVAAQKQNCPCNGNGTSKQQQLLQDEQRQQQEQEQEQEQEGEVKGKHEPPTLTLDNTQPKPSSNPINSSSNPGPPGGITKSSSSSAHPHPHPHPHPHASVSGEGATTTTTADCNTGGKRARTISRSDIITTIYGSFGASPSSPTSASLRTKSDESGNIRSFRDKFAKYDHQHQQGSVVPFELADPAPKKKASPKGNGNGNGSIDGSGGGDDGSTVSFYQQLVNRLAPPHEKSWNWPNPNSKPVSKNIYDERAKKAAGGGRRGERTGGSGKWADDDHFVISKKSAALCCVVSLAVLGLALARPSSK